MFFKSKKRDQPTSSAAEDPVRSGGPPPLPDQSAQSLREPPRPSPAPSSDALPDTYDFPDDATHETETKSRPPVQSAQPKFGPEKYLQASLGQIVALLSRAPGVQDLPIATVRTAVIPGVAIGQFLLGEGHNHKTGQSGPLAAVMWANVSPQTDAAIAEDRGQLLRLTESQWREGDITWITLAIGEQNLLRQMIEQLRTTTFKGRPVKVFASGADGPVVLEPR